MKRMNGATLFLFGGKKGVAKAIEVLGRHACPLIYDVQLEAALDSVVTGCNDDTALGLG